MDDDAAAKIKVRKTQNSTINIWIELLIRYKFDLNPLRQSTSYFAALPVLPYFPPIKTTPTVFAAKAPTR